MVFTSQKEDAMRHKIIKNMSISGALRWLAQGIDSYLERQADNNRIQHYMTEQKNSEENMAAMPRRANDHEDSVSAKNSSCFNRAAGHIRYRHFSHRR